MIKGLTVVALLSLLSVLLIGCGSDDGNAGTGSDDTEVAVETRIFDRDIELTSDDLVALGLKPARKYDISTLPGGVEARMLYWQVNDVPVDYEARFYETYEDAVKLGTAPAEEGSGEDAVLDSNDAEYKEGIRDRRKMFHYLGGIQPKYGAYAIYGNMVVLCEGREEVEARDRCAALTTALSESAGE